jgi:hypothetical protein
MEMDNPSFNQDVEIAEKYDQAIAEHNAGIEDILGTMEAISEEEAKLAPVQQLSDHQQEMVDKLQDLAQSEKSVVYAVADKAAVTVPANEGFKEISSQLVRKAALAFSSDIPKSFDITSKALRHYFDMADKLRQRLVNLLPLLKNRDYPYCDVFEYGAYSRFFQVAGKPIESFYDFQNALDLQVEATHLTVKAADSYSIPIMQKLLETLQQLKPNEPIDAHQFEILRDAIQFRWEMTWEDAGLTTAPGQTPQSIINTFPERKFRSLAALLDNRYLVAHRPKNDGGKDPAKISESIRHYGATIAFDKVKGASGYSIMSVPNCDDLVKTVIQTINTLNDLQGLAELAKKNEVFAKEIKQATEILNKAIKSTDVKDAQFFGFVSEYFKLASAVAQAIQQPYVSVSWMYLRCAMVVTSLAELSVIEDSKNRIVAAKFLAKQNADFSNPAFESYQTTQRVLKAVKRA